MFDRIISLSRYSRIDQQNLRNIAFEKFDFVHSWITKLAKHLKTFYYKWILLPCLHGFSTSRYQLFSKNIDKWVLLSFQESLKLLFLILSLGQENSIALPQLAFTSSMLKKEKSEQFLTSHVVLVFALLTLN